MKLYMIHTGYQDTQTGVFEHHTNIFVVAENKISAEKKVKEHNLYIAKKMHVDGIIELTEIDGYKIELSKIIDIT